MVTFKKDRSVKPNQIASKMMFKFAPKDHVFRWLTYIIDNGKDRSENSRSPKLMLTRIIFDGVRRFRSFSTARNTKVFPNTVDVAKNAMNENHNILAPAKLNCGVIVLFKLDIFFFTVTRLLSLPQLKARIFHKHSAVWT
jgi:hypothetical protein